MLAFSIPPPLFFGRWHNLWIAPSYICTDDDGLFHCCIDISKMTISVTESQTSHVTCLITHISTTSLIFPFTRKNDIKSLEATNFCRWFESKQQLNSWEKKQKKYTSICGWQITCVFIRFKIVWVVKEVFFNWKQSLGKETLICQFLAQSCCLLFSRVFYEVQPKDYKPWLLAYLNRRVGY